MKQYRLPSLFLIPAITFSLANLLLAQGSFPDLRISEFMAENDSTLLDADGAAEDWIELQNAGLTPVDLAGYSLTDDPAVLNKWVIPENTPLNPGGQLVIFASGKNRTADINDLHTNFSLDSGGDYLALVKPDGTVQHDYANPFPNQRADVSYGIGDNTSTDTVILLEPDADCTWMVPDSDIGNNWQMTGFDDAAWNAGKTGVGYGLGYEDFIGAGSHSQSEMQVNNASVYIRIPFQVTNPGAMVSMTLSMLFEDGFVAYINGEEVASENKPSPLNWNSTSLGGINLEENDGPDFYDLDFAGHLQVGENILAIHGLNSAANSSDVLFLPALQAEVSSGDSLGEGFFLEPTPGAPNSTKVDGFVSDTSFDFDRGLYDAPFSLTIATATPNTTIRYTTDGSRPTEDTGTVYTGPISISTTTVVRAAAFRNDWVPTNVDTQTYIFPADVYGANMVEALTAVPTMSLVTERTQFENEGAGNDYNEYQSSIEMIFPDGREGFQEDAGLTNYGGRFTNFRKKSFRLYFREEFGTTKLRYPIFDDFEYANFPPAEEFDAINLRSGSHDMSARGAYMASRFVDDTMLEMGNIAPHGRFVHLYLNGRYWGQYHLRERWDAEMASSYFGGAKEDYDAISANNSGMEFLPGTVYDGTADFWNETRTLLQGADPFVNAAGNIDMANVIDFMLLWTSGECESEFRAFGSQSRGVPFKFMVRDPDGYLPNGSWSHDHPVTHNGPMSAMTELRTSGNPDYDVFLADRIHKHFFNDGALTVEKSVERLRKRFEEMRPGFAAEAQRWGFQTVNSWESYVNGWLNNGLPQRTPSMIQKFRQSGMYPSIDAPEFSQHGGSLPADGNILVTADGVIYHTTDGSDPRLPGGAINPAATVIDGRGTPVSYIEAESDWKYLDDGSDQGTAWREVGYDDSAWQTSQAQFGYTEGDENTLLSFGDNAADKHITYYFRKTFTATNVANLLEVNLGVLRDDGAIVYINGTEVARDNMPGGAINFDTLAISQVSGANEDTFHPFTAPPGVLVEGENTIAVEIHQASASSSDTSFDLTLGALASSGTPTVHFDDSGTLRARTFDSATGEWSALNEAFFYPDSAPAAAGNLVVSEFHYHPAAATQDEITAGFANPDLFEFLEVQNISSQIVNLSGMQFVDGIILSVPESPEAFLDPGATGLFVVNRDAFEFRYGTDLPVIATYAGNLRNSGERVELVSATAEVIHAFEYDDVSPWPVTADGTGPSLELKDPDSNPDHNLPASWRASSQTGGTPGAVATGLDYQSWLALFFSPAEIADPLVTGPGTDNDNDGLTLFMEFALALDPGRSEAEPAIAIEEGDGTGALVSYRRSTQAQGVQYTVEFTNNLTGWSTNPALGTFEEISTISISDSAEIVTLRFVAAEDPADAMKIQFRLRVLEQ